MGLFDKILKKKNKDLKLKDLGDNSCDKKDNLQAYIEIARIVCDGDEKVIQEASDCIFNPQNYFNAHKGRYENRGIDEFSDSIFNKWIGLVDILIIHNYVCERDWKDEKEDFMYFLNNLKGFKENNLTIDSEWLNEDDDIVKWCQVLDEKWNSQGIGVMCFDIGSDSFVFFLGKLANLECLKESASLLGQRIDFAKYM